VAPEPWHIVGAAGEPPFENSWKNAEASSGFSGVAFYKDREGVVHLRGFTIEGKSEVVFRLPAGFRPASGTSLAIPMVCTGGVSCTTFVAPGEIVGPGVKEPIYDNAVVAPGSALSVSFDGVTFRAES
jgi:hypothetical protein